MRSAHHACVWNRERSWLRVLAPSQKQMKEKPLAAKSFRLLLVSLEFNSPKNLSRIFLEIMKRGAKGRKFLTLNDIEGCEELIMVSKRLTLTGQNSLFVALSTTKMSPDGCHCDHYVASMSPNDIVGISDKCSKSRFPDSSVRKARFTDKT